MKKLYNVSIFFEECEKRDAEKNIKIATINDNIYNLSAPTFIVFHRNENNTFSRLSAMTLYKKERLGYSKREYKTVPQKYLNYLYEAH